MHLVVTSLASTAMSMFGLSLVKPCMPPLVSMAILQCGDKWDKDDYSFSVVALFSGIYEAFTWWVVFSVVSIPLAVALIYPAEVMKIWLQQVKRGVLTDKNSTRITDYRTVQWLSNLRNCAFEYPSLVQMVGGIIVGETASLYVLLTSTKILPLPVLAFFVIVAVDLFVVIHVIFHSLSDLFEVSVGFLDEMKLYHKFGNRKWFKKFLKSCPPLKLTIGDGQYFDRMTALGIWQYCVDQLITLLYM
ncbi:uncharacterized protein LOC118439372 [Folsomia candida]|uniref:uncharacterized protein LOC118439372 n=1 Tax=Folsomia candida TaxID=158441 RepID=UPI0016050DB2|nr:uncharacterized protein LOC118439372 [Folsomia candida]